MSDTRNAFVSSSDIIDGPPSKAPTARLDVVLGKRWNDLSRTYAKTLILDGRVRVEGEVVTDPAHKVSPGTHVSVDVPSPEPLTLVPQAMDLPILYEDEDLIVLDKPAGLVVHPAAGNWDGTLVNGLLHHCQGSLSGISGVERPGIVHRLDKETSGLMVVAKTNEAHLGLTRQFADRTLSRTYVALVHGFVTPKEGSIEGAIGRHPRNRQKMALLDHGGKPARTHYRCLKWLSYSPAVDDKEGPRTPSQGRSPKGLQFSLLQCVLDTGRTHQIRVHMAHHGWGVVGDTLYASGQQIRSVSSLLRVCDWHQGRHALHARRLTFRHPTSGLDMDFEAPIPGDMERLLALLGHSET